MTSENFYATLPVVKNFMGVAELRHYHPLPEDWHIVVSDIRNSTQAIEDGQYKAVNFVGASVITAILNVTKPTPIPFVFGGDGATLCIPPQFVPAARTALSATQTMSETLYGLSLRAGIIPVSLVTQESQKRVLVARYRVSDNYIQAVFTGGGLNYAEDYLKMQADSPYHVHPQAEDEADFSGLECRWYSIPSPHEESVALLVNVIDSDMKRQGEIYQAVLAQIEAIYGSEQEYHPLRLRDLRLSLRNRELYLEGLLLSYGKSWLGRLLSWLTLRGMTLLGWVLMGFGLRVGGVDWGQYRAQIIANTDYRKFDDMMRLILSGTAAQRRQLEQYLAQKFATRQLVYGMHPATSTLMTCLISDYDADHFHFVDGANGGYALAARQMKAQLKQIAEE